MGKQYEFDVLRMWFKIINIDSIKMFIEYKYMKMI